MSHLLFRLFSRLQPVKGLLQIQKERLLVKLLSQHIDWADSDISGLYRNPSVRMNKTIWLMWTQGLELAPPLVRKCCESVEPYRGDYDVVLLTADNLSQYVRLPEHIAHLYREKKIGEALHSDLVRAYLLLQYGGIWRDATCYQSAPYPSYVVEAPFFMFSKSLLGGQLSPIIGSSWFIKAEADNVLLRKAFAFLCEYFRHNSTPHNYYLFHLTLTMLVESDEDCRLLWQQMPYVCNMDPHVFYFHWDLPYSAEGYRHLLNACFIHKLSYKYDPSILEGEQNMIKHFLES